MDHKPDILTIAEAGGCILKRRGRLYWMTCPSHEDKTPSLKIDPERQSFHCFSCNDGGDVIAFVQKLHECDFKTAVRILGMDGKSRTLPNAREKKKRDLIKSFRQWEWSCRGELADRFREINQKTHGLKSMEEAEMVADLFHALPVVEYHLDLLWNGDDETKYELYRRLVNGK